MYDYKADEPIRYQSPTFFSIYHGHQESEEDDNGSGQGSLFLAQSAAKLKADEDEATRKKDGFYIYCLFGWREVIGAVDSSFFIPWLICIFFFLGSVGEGW